MRSTAQASVLKELKDAGIRDYFDQVICGDMVSHSKPHPEIFLTACAALGAKPEKTIVIEDSYNGIRAARRAEAIPIMVPDLLLNDKKIDDKIRYEIQNYISTNESLNEGFSQWRE